MINYLLFTISCYFNYVLLLIIILIIVLIIIFIIIVAMSSQSPANSSQLAFYELTKGVSFVSLIRHASSCVVPRMFVRDRRRPLDVCFSQPLHSASNATGVAGVTIFAAAGDRGITKCTGI